MFVPWVPFSTPPCLHFSFPALPFPHAPPVLPCLYLFSLVTRFLCLLFPVSVKPSPCLSFLPFYYLFYIFTFLLPYHLFFYLYVPFFSTLPVPNILPCICFPFQPQLCLYKTFLLPFPAHCYLAHPPPPPAPTFPAQYCPSPVHLLPMNKLKYSLLTLNYSPSPITYFPSAKYSTLLLKKLAHSVYNKPLEKSDFADYVF